MIDLSNLSDIEIYNLWEKGISYWQATNALTDDKTLERKRELFELDQAHSKTQQADIKKKTANGEFGFMDMIDTFTDKPYKAEENEVERQMHFNLINALRSGRIFALGFETPRGLDSRPIVIPSDIIENGDNTFSRVLRDNKKIKKGKIKIEEVCFVWKRYADTALSITSKEASESIIIEQQPINNKVGRSSRAPEILDAYDNLFEEEKITLSTPIQTMAHLIREFILSRSDNKKQSKTGLSDETIRRTVRYTQNTK